MNISAELAIILGAIIGGTISIITNWIQQKNQLNRDLIKTAYEMAIKEYETILKVAKPGSTILPLESFVTYYIKYLNIVNSKKFKISNLKEVREYRKQLNSFYEKESKKLELN